MKQLPILDFTADYDGIKLPAIIDSDYAVQTGPETYNLTASDIPTLVYR
jgi:hypothetical protein